MNAPSKDYRRAIELCKEQHGRGSKCNSGAFLRSHYAIIKEIIDRLRVKSILDYGCGRGKQYTWLTPDGQTLEELWGIEVTKYDPAVERYAKEPRGTYDLLICTHVLGLVPVQDLPWVIRRLYDLTNKAVYIVLNTGRATRKWKKARYRVATIPPPEWEAKQWLALLSRDKPDHLEVQFTARPREEEKAFYAGRYISPAGTKEWTWLG